MKRVFRLVVAVALCAVILVFSSCVTRLGLHASGQNVITIRVDTTSDHFGVAVNGVTVSEAKVTQKHVVQAGSFDIANPKYFIGGAQGLDAAYERQVQSCTWELMVAPRPGFDRFILKYNKGHLGTLRIEVTYPSEVGEVVTKTFSMSEGPEHAEGSIDIPVTVM